jgi:predicted nucleic acid-binding protein
MIIVSNTTPLNYLIIIGEAGILHQLFGQVVIPQAVIAELQRPETPDIVRRWISQHPSWLEVRAPSAVDTTLRLGAGEREAISLAQELKADQILLDDKQARKAALERGLAVTGTLSVLEAAGQRDLINLPAALERLRQTDFRAPTQLVEDILRRHAERELSLQEQATTYPPDNGEGDEQSPEREAKN